MLLKQGISKDQLNKFGREYADLKKQLNQVFQLNQSMIDFSPCNKTDERVQIVKTIPEIVQNVKKLFLKYQGHFFCCLLQEIQLPRSGQRQHKTLLSKLIQTLVVFLKFKDNLKNYGKIIWDLIKYLYCYQQAMKTDLVQFKTDFQLIQRLRDFYARKYLSQISQDITQLKNYKNWSTETLVSNKWLNLFKISRKILLSNHIKLMNSSIDELLQNLPINACQQIHFNNIKQLYDQQLLKLNNKKHPCCSVFFYKNQKIALNSHKYNDYENVRMPMNDQTDKKIRKIMLSFLNTDGGIHYLGINEEEKQLNVQGIWMNDQNLIQFYKRVYRIALQIQPNNQNQLKQAPKIPRKISDKLTYSLRLTRFVQVEINPLIDREHGNIDYVDTNHEKKTVRVCVVKIKVKATPKYDTYMAKGGKSLESYYRKDGAVETILPSQFPKVFTERSLSYMQSEISVGNPDCPDCRHQYLVQDS